MEQNVVVAVAVGVAVVSLLIAILALSRIPRAHRAGFNQGFQMGMFVERQVGGIRVALREAMSRMAEDEESHDDESHDGDESGS